MDIKELQQELEFGKKEINKITKILEEDYGIIPKPFLDIEVDVNSLDDVIKDSSRDIENFNKYEGLAVVKLLELFIKFEIELDYIKGQLD